MEFSHVTNTSYDGTSGSAERFNADYGELMSIGQHLVELSGMMSYTTTSSYQNSGPGAAHPAMQWMAPIHHEGSAWDEYKETLRLLSKYAPTDNMQLVDISLDPAKDYRKRAGENLGIIGQALLDVAALYRDSENQVEGLNGAWTTTGHIGTFAAATEGFADGYYQKVEADQAEADRLQKEQDERDAKKKAEDEYMLGIVSSLCPGTAAWYQQMLNDAAIEEAIAYYDDPDRGNNPALAAKLREEYEAMKKAREEAAKSGGEAGAYGDGFGSGDDASGFAGFGGGGGSDFGGGGGGGGFDLGGSGLETDWGSSDFASDLLDDNINADEYLDAAAGLDDITSVNPDGAVAAGMDVMSGDSADGAASGLWAHYGPQLAEVVQRYGMQAGLVLGGAATLYATREQTTEAVAHVAEFMTTKCRPAVNDVMEQVRGAVKQTHVRLDNAKSGVTAAARGERAGDLIG